jgi:uncharacterized protein
MIRVLIWVGIAYLLYRALKNILGIGSGPASRRTFSGAPEQIDDLMIQDPYCEVYFPRKEGHHLRFKGEDLYFCSPECRDKYLKENTGGVE